MTAAADHMAIGQPPRAVLADDERLMRDQLRSRLQQVWPDLQIVAEARNGMEAVELVSTLRPDIVFLDIRMPGMTGVQAAREILQMPTQDDEWLPEIVFITAYDQHAVQAFEQGAADYVLKPAEPRRLELTVERLRQRLRARTSGNEPQLAEMSSVASLQPILARLFASMRSELPSQVHAQAQGAAGSVATQYLEFVQAASGTSVRIIPVRDVLFFVSDEKYTRVQTLAFEALIRKPIKELVNELDPNQFWQIHRSTIVNVQAVEAVTRDERGRQIVSVRGHPEKLEVSRSFAGVFRGM